MTRLLPFLLMALLSAVELAAPARAQQPNPAPAATQPSTPTQLTPDEARRAAEILQDPAKRTQLIDALNAISKALPPPIPDKPADKPAEPAPAPAAGTVSLAPDSLGAQLLTQVSHWPERIGRNVSAATQTLTDAPLVWFWARRIISDPTERHELLTALLQMVLVVGCALLAEFLAQRAMQRPIAALVAHAPNGEAHPEDAPTAEDEAGAAEPAPDRSVDPIAELARKPEANAHPAAVVEGEPGLAAAAEKEPETEAARGAKSWNLLRRLPFAAMRLLLELIPVGVFWGLAMLLSATLSSLTAQTAISLVIDAYATARIIMSVARMLVSPSMGRLRLLDIADGPAETLISWLRWIVGVAVFGTAIANLALLFGLYEDAYDTMVRAVALIVAILLGVAVLRCRLLVADRLRAPADAEGSTARWRNWFAATWHLLALIAIAGGWIFASAGVRAGLGGLRLLIGSVLIIVASRIAAIVLLGLLDRVVRLSEAHQLSDAAASRTRHYQAVGRIGVTAIVAIATGISLIEFWGGGILFWFEHNRAGSGLASAVITVGIATLAAVVVWEAANTGLERRLARLSEAGATGHSARLRTLMPIVRAALLTSIVVIVGLTALSQIGVNIAPLLAGAGIAGVALGFGSQKLVQDVITGMFVLLENAIQVGDTVTVAGLTGSVERLSVRNIWLRGGDGAVHIVPFSSVTAITNSNRGLGNAAVSAVVTNFEDADRVMDIFREIVAEMRDDETFAKLMLGDLKIWVDSIKPDGTAIGGIIPSIDTGRWTIQREFNRRAQKRLRELGINLAKTYANPDPEPEQNAGLEENDSSAQNADPQQKTSAAA